MLGKLVLAALSLGFAGTASADTEFFVQARAGIAHLDHFRIDDEEPIGQILVGARWGAFGVEAGYLKTQEFTDSFVSRNIANLVLDYSNEIDGWFVGLNGRCALGDGPWHVTGRAGALNWSMDDEVVPSRGPRPPSVDADDTGLYAGAGIGRDFGEHFAVGLALDYFRLDHRGDSFIDASMRALSLTVEHRF